MKPEDILPGKISSITPQKKNKERYSVFVDENFLIGVDNSTLLNHQLRVGLKISPAFFKRLQRDERRNAVKSHMLKLLSRREHPRGELFTKAKQKNYPPEIIDSVLDELEEKDFIDDLRFAIKFAQDKCSLNKWGPYKIGSHLRKKGINRTVSESVIEQVFESLDMKDRLMQLVLKRKRYFLREENPIKRKKKVINYLAQKGYPSSNIYHHINGLMKALDIQKR